MFWKSVHSFSIFKEEMGLFIIIIIIIYSHITELSVQYNAESQSVYRYPFALLTHTLSAWYLDFLHLICHLHST